MPLSDEQLTRCLCGQAANSDLEALEAWLAESDDNLEVLLATGIQWPVPAQPKAVHWWTWAAAACLAIGLAIPLLDSLHGGPLQMEQAPAYAVADTLSIEP